ncbi:MAG: DUF4105 domain-containing protein, partial [Bdellovibrionales bacterium]|nr:DUF4105 domain-containing protein [Bdellovibrionales bacterium]
KRRIVSSFKGFVDDTYVKSFKGLTGDYKSFPQFYNFQHLVEKYTKNEYRDVLVYKLNLNKDQIRSLFQQFVEMFWTYRSSYHFLNNNCAVELRNLLKAILPFPHPFWNSIASTPTRLVEELKLFQLIDKEPSESHLSLFGEVQNAFEQLKLLSPQVYEKFKSEEEYLSLPTTVKEQLFLRASSSHKNLLIAKSLFLIEQEYFIYLLKMKIDVGSKEVQDKIDRDEELKGLYLDIASIKHQILTTDILRSDYRFGIPKADQVTGLPMIYALGQNLSQKKAELTILAEKYVDSGIMSKISEQKEWIRFLRNTVSRRE